jgi:hypothetical protein
MNPNFIPANPATDLFMVVNNADGFSLIRVPVEHQIGQLNETQALARIREMTDNANRFFGAADLAKISIGWIVEHAIAIGLLDRIGLNVSRFAEDILQRSGGTIRKWRIAACCYAEFESTEFRPLVLNHYTLLSSAEVGTKTLIYNRALKSAGAKRVTGRHIIEAATALGQTLKYHSSGTPATTRVRTAPHSQPRLVAPICDDHEAIDIIARIVESLRTQGAHGDSNDLERVQHHFERRIAITEAANDERSKIERLPALLEKEIVITQTIEMKTVKEEPIDTAESNKMPETSIEDRFVPFNPRTLVPLFQVTHIHTKTDFCTLFPAAFGDKVGVGLEIRCTAPNFIRQYGFEPVEGMDRYFF